MNQEELYVNWYPDCLVHRVPKVSYLYYILRDQKIGKMYACFSDTVCASVPYFGGLLEIDRKYLITQDIVPNINDFYNPEFEWCSRLFSDKPLTKITKNCIKSIWVGTPIINLAWYKDPVRYAKVHNKVTIKTLNMVKKWVTKFGYNVETIGTLNGARFNKYFKTDIKAHTLGHTRMEKLYPLRAKNMLKRAKLEIPDLTKGCAY